MAFIVTNEIEVMHCRGQCLVLQPIKLDTSGTGSRSSFTHTNYKHVVVLATYSRAA